jgi:hypothetical protein
MSKNKEKHGLFYKLAGVRTMKFGFEHTKDMLKSLKYRNPNDYIDESFDEALDRLGVPEENKAMHLINIYKNMKVSFIILGFAVIFFLCIGVAGNLIKANYLSSFLYLSITVAFLSVIANNSFRCFQIRRKQLGGLKEWASTPKEWYPVALKKVWK